MESKSISIPGDITAIAGLSVVPMILEIICKTTGMGFAAIARVTTEQWVACGVRDEIKFGLLPGGELKLDTTICHEIRQNGRAVVIDNVVTDETYATHHTPAMYGFQSYISVPIARQDGTFFGTLCAIDPQPTILNTPEIIGMFKIYAELISFHLNKVEQSGPNEIEDHEKLIDQELKALLAAVSKHNDDILAAGQQPYNKRSLEFISMISDSTHELEKLLLKLKGDL